MSLDLTVTDLFCGAGGSSIGAAAAGATLKMAAPTSYEVRGNKRQRVRQYGNAVTPPVMSMILERCIASLDGAA